MHYIVYFAGPLALGWFGAKLLRQRARVFAIGLVTFLAAWVVMQVASGLAMQALGLSASSFGYAFLVAALAATCEEPARYLVFSRLAAFRHNHSWPASLVYALGHHGMETIIAGLTLLLTVAVVRYRPDAIADPATLADAQATAAVGPWLNLYGAFERLLVGLLIHACFSGVVMLGVARRRVRWLAVAMAWHFAHNLVAFNVHRLPAPEVMAKAWIVVILVGYTYALLRIYHALERVEPAAQPSGAPPAAGSMFLPGRSA